MTSSDPPEPATRRPSARPRHRPWRLLAAAWLVAAAAAAQDETPETPALPTGTARMVREGRAAATVPVSFAADGPRFALGPIAATLGAELRVGPLGDSHTLVYEDRHILLGPGQALMVTVAPDGHTQKTITQLAQVPFRDAEGLKVSLDLLERALGEPLNYRFAWKPDELVLEVSRPELRQLRGTVNLVHLHRTSIVEIQLSEAPRYRVERGPGVLDVRLIGDRLELPVRTPREADALVTNVVVTPDLLRLELAANAVAGEPRLLSSPARLVIEVFEQAASEAGPRSAAGAPRPEARRAPGIRVIAIDPGHGGSETGAIGPRGLAEEDLTLQVGRVLKAQLERRVALDKDVVLTRNADVDVPLETRTAIANQNQADLFISLHFNSSFGSSAHGAETYFLSREASDQMAAALAAEENRAGGAGEDPELGLQLILWDLAQSRHLAESQRFANLVQEELNLTLGLRDRGVKQAPFSVLMGAKMPAVLVELGFLSNPEEEEKLRSPAYQAELVDALVRAVIRFKNLVEDGGVAAGSSGARRGPARRGPARRGTRKAS